MADTIAAVVLALATVSMAISIVGLIGCGIVALLTRRRWSASDGGRRQQMGGPGW